MKIVVFAGLLVAILGAGSALAADKCHAPVGEWQWKEALQKKLEAEGWTIRQIKVDDGCFKGYGTAPSGKRAETYFDPKTFVVVASK